ncbi:hypothetical protein RB595_006360 [Gaeumannomyces hyphopodioides]
MSHRLQVLRRVQSTYILSGEPLRPGPSRSQSVTRMLGAWPEKTAHGDRRGVQELADDHNLQQYCLSDFPDSLRRSTSSNWSSSSDSSGYAGDICGTNSSQIVRDRGRSPGHGDDSGDDASDEASSSDRMSIAELDIAPDNLDDEVMGDAEDPGPAAEPEPAPATPPSAPKKPKYAPRFLPYTKTPPRGYKVLQKAGDGRDRWSPGDGFTRKEARPLGVCIGSKRKLSDLAAAVGFLDLTPQSDARELGWQAPCEAETPRKRRLAPGFAAARDADLDDSLRRGRSRRRLAPKARSPARAPSARAPKKTAQPENVLDTGIGTGGSGLPATVHCSHPLSLRPGLPRPAQSAGPTTPREGLVLASLTP